MLESERDGGSAPMQGQADEARASAAEARRMATALSERVESLQSDLNHSELRREELETELTNTQEVRTLHGSRWSVHP